jgi:hypothetical protein
VVEERCGCVVDRCFEVDEGDRTGDKPGSDSGGCGWRGGEDDVFSDGRTDSDFSEHGEAMLDIQEEGSKQLSARIVVNEGIRNEVLQSQTFLTVAVVEKIIDQCVETSHVEEEGELCSQIPRKEEVGDKSKSPGLEVGPGDEYSNCLMEGCDMLAAGEHACDTVLVVPSLVVVGGNVGPNGSGSLTCNDLMELEAQGKEGCDPTLSVRVEAQVEDVDLLQLTVGEVQGIDDEVASLGDVEDIGREETLRISQLSEAATANSQELAKSKVKRGTKKPPQNPARSSSQSLGVPKFCQLAESMKEVGKRRKEAKKKHRGGDAINNGEISTVGVVCNDSLQPQVVISTPDSVEPPAIELQVVLPVPNFGIMLMMDEHGESVPDSISDSDDVVARREEEANILIGIQKQVGFTFEGGEEEIQSKLVEVEILDSEQKVVRELRRSDQ